MMNKNLNRLFEIMAKGDAATNADFLEAERSLSESPKLKREFFNTLMMLIASAISEGRISSAAIAKSKAGL